MAENTYRTSDHSDQSTDAIISVAPFRFCALIPTILSLVPQIVKASTGLGKKCSRTRGSNTYPKHKCDVRALYKTHEAKMSYIVHYIEVASFWFPPPRETRVRIREEYGEIRCVFNDN